MSTIVIKIKPKKLKRGDSIPEFANKSQKRIEVNNGDTIKWKYDNQSNITIESDLPFNKKSNATRVSGQGQAEIVVDGANGLLKKVIGYNIITSDTDIELDPMIIIRDPSNSPFTLKNPIVTFAVGLATGVIFGQLIL